MTTGPNPYAATLMEWLHPMRVSRQMFGSSFSRFMPVIASFAPGIRNEPDDAALKKAEAAMFDAVRETLAKVRVTRDDALEQVFERVYGSGGAPADNHSANIDQKVEGEQRRWAVAKDGDGGWVEEWAASEGSADSWSFCSSSVLSSLQCAAEIHDQSFDAQN